MPNGPQRVGTKRFPEFLVEAEQLLAKTEECLSHLQLISNDKDAIDCMLNTLLKLATQALMLSRWRRFPSFPCTSTACSIMRSITSTCTKKP
jgi:hypothetical protein